MHELVHSVHHELLPLDEYWPDFERNFWRTGTPGFWKLERQQHFQEPGYDSWEAFARGDWSESLRLLEEGRGDLAAEQRRMAEAGFTARRVRVVEEPISPYLQWELHVLRLRDECGGPVRVVPVERVARYEAAEPLPEIYTLGTELMYEAVYDERGILQAARRYTDRAVIMRCQRFISELYASAEPIASYFERRVAGLPAPEGQLLP
ncbi:DUF6879 family protein [Saccharothrix sp. NPDC042600]|uniref:DUF6879 family protein n=1 Tax=Saccharothrix TaxID=2071 RepID=UPI0033CC9E3E|nr:hypothetical protein GCM10017745_37490 [Saccharothrix mutabilis subsp. capreolus]